MENRNVVSQEEWVAARIEHLAKEKEFTRAEGAPHLQHEDGTR